MCVCKVVVYRYLWVIHLVLMANVGRVSAFSLPTVW